MIRLTYLPDNCHKYRYRQATQRLSLEKVGSLMAEYLDLLLPRDKLSRCIIASVSVFDQLLDSCVEICF